MFDEDQWHCSGFQKNTNAQLSIGDETIEMQVDASNCYEFFDKVNRANINVGGYELPDYLILQMADIPPADLFTEESKHCLETYNLCSGLNAKNPEELDKESIFWIDICSIIKTEMDKWIPIKQKQLADRQASQTKRH